MPAALMVLVLGLLFAPPESGIAVATDMAVYAQGDPVQVTIQNGGPDVVTRGGIVCDDVWPLAIEQLQSDGTWPEVPVPRRTSCIGVAAMLFGPGQSQAHMVSLSLDPGTYRVAYAFNVVGNGSAASSPLVAYSDPFDVIQADDSIP